MKEQRLAVSHTLQASLRKELKKFATFSYKTESEVLEEALTQYFQSKKAFQELQRAESEKQEFYQGLAEDCDFQNLVVPRDSICGYSNKKDGE